MADDLTSVIKDTISSRLTEMGSFNLIIVGKAGVGKSTLINEVFEGELATCGVGRSVTKEIRKISKEGVPLALIDTVGLELADYNRIVKDLKTYVKTQNSLQDVGEHVHAAWICIAEGTPRAERAEAEFATALNDLGIGVVIVITQSFRKKIGEELRSELQRMIPEAANVVRVVAKDIEMDEGQVIQARGLDTLIEVTSQLVPASTARAFATVQKIQMDLKDRAAKNSVRWAAGIAAGVAATPLPVVNFVALVPATIGMLWDISRIYGFQADRKFIFWLMTSAFGVMAGDGFAKATFAILLQFFPGISAILNATVTGVLVGATVTALGEAYIDAMKKLYVEGKLSEKLPIKEIEADIKNGLFAMLEAAKQQITSLNLASEIPVAMAKSSSQTTAP